MKLDRRSFLALLGATTASLVAACGPAPAAQPTSQPASAQGPRFNVDQKEIDFGNVKFERMVNAAFKVTNTGTGNLVLKVPPVVRAETGC